MGFKDSLPRESVLKAIAGVILVVVPVAMAYWGYRSLGIFDILPIVIGGLLMREYFRELGFNS